MPEIAAFHCQQSPLEDWPRFVTVQEVQKKLAGHEALSAENGWGPRDSVMSNHLADVMQRNLEYSRSPVRPDQVEIFLRDAGHLAGGVIPAPTNSKLSGVGTSTTIDRAIRKRQMPWCEARHMNALP